MPSILIKSPTVSPAKHPHTKTWSRFQKPNTSPKEKEGLLSKVRDYGTLYQPAFGWRKTTWPSEDRLKLCSFDVKRQEPSSAQKRFSSHVPRYISFSFIHATLTCPIPPQTTLYHPNMPYTTLTCPIPPHYTNLPLYHSILPEPATILPYTIIYRGWFGVRPVHVRCLLGAGQPRQRGGGGDTIFYRTG